MPPTLILHLLIDSLPYSCCPWPQLIPRLQPSPYLDLWFIWSDIIVPIHLDSSVLIPPLRSSNYDFIFLLCCSLSLKHYLCFTTLWYSWSTLIHLVFTHLPSLPSATIYSSHSPQIFLIISFDRSAHAPLHLIWSALITRGGSVRTSLFRSTSYFAPLDVQIYFKVHYPLDPSSLRGGRVCGDQKEWLLAISDRGKSVRAAIAGFMRKQW